MSDYYVYGYFDPRNMKPFYIGKGRNLRMYAHLSDELSSEKTRKIEEIRNDGEEPLIRVLVNGCTETEALLVESTLIWWTQDELTNKVSGHKKELFRPNPEFSLLKKIPGFDFSNGIYLVNCGDGDTRKWEDFKQYGFLCAGHDPKWSEPLKRLNEGDLVVAYLKGDGYIGIGKVSATATKAKDFINSDGIRLRDVRNLRSQNLFHDANDEKLAEYCIGVGWIVANDRGNGKFKSNAGLYTTPLIVTSLFNQPKTIEFIETEFGIEVEEYF